MSITAEKARFIAKTKAACEFSQTIANIDKLISNACNEARLHILVDVIGQIYLEIVKEEYTARGFEVILPTILIDIPDRPVRVKIAW